MSAGRRVAGTAAGGGWRVSLFLVLLAPLLLGASAPPLPPGTPPIRWIGGGHVDVGSVAISPDGALIASGSPTPGR